MGLLLCPDTCYTYSATRDIYGYNGYPRQESLPYPLFCFMSSLPPYDGTRRSVDDPELLATYMELVVEAKVVVKVYVEARAARVAQIIADGVARSEFPTTDPVAAGQALFDATASFHHPTHALEWSNPRIDAAFDCVWSLVQWGPGERTVPA
jgi:Tetracyclin repressor-like, C-terminal domain